MRMNVNRLSQDELIYELKIRGIATGTCNEMKKLLSAARRMEKAQQSFSYPPHPYTFDEDATAIVEKHDELRKDFDNLEGPQGSPSAVRMASKIAHIFGRFERMAPTDEEQTQRKANLAAKIISLLTDVEEKVDGVAEEHVAEEAELSDVVRRLSDIPGNSQFPRSSSPIRHQPPPVHTTHVVPVSKWNIQFSGDQRSLSVNAFLERVDELRVARGVSKLHLYDSAIDLFTGRALLWYRDARKHCQTWEELVVGLKEEFQPFDYQEKFLDEVKRRTQGPDESIGIYLAVMSAMFGRLERQLNEEEQLRILLKNLSPFYQHQLALVDVTSLVQLKKLCRKLEDRRATVQAFSLPPKRNLLEPDLAYVATTSTEEVSLVSTSAHGVQSPSSLANTRLCFNCNQPGHRAIGCIQPRRKYCYKCKKAGVTVRTCPVCNSENDIGCP